LENYVPADPVIQAPHKEIPFGTLLPVRLVGSVYTLKNAGGVVRMELTRPVEGKGYSYPAGTVVVGNARGGESARAFVTIIGLIDPAKTELLESKASDEGSLVSGRGSSMASKIRRPRFLVRSEP
jgi:hypothetical protein